MKVGLSMLYCLGQPFSSLLKQLETVEVSNVEVLDEGLHALNDRRVHSIRRIAVDRGLELSVHAPFVDINIASPSESVRIAVLKRLKKSIQLSGKLNAVFWVFHPGMRTGISHFTPGLDWKFNLESVRQLLSTAENTGVKLAIENGLHPLPFLLKTPSEFVRFYEDLGADLGLTLDVGHANVNGQIFEFIKTFPDKIVHAHLHDNHGKADEHLGIGDGNINWVKVVRAFKKIGFRGALIVESEKNALESVQTLKALVQTV
ncbi:sugar phosphate isomerase/epimerase [Candidatus Bathyarchaeota archaeon]|nr:MAG: sugar phosphate isomerase/epimerase [Candidatus Bathyarchaeota archaeon]